MQELEAEEYRLEPAMCLQLNGHKAVLSILQSAVSFSPARLAKNRWAYFAGASFAAIVDTRILLS